MIDTRHSPRFIIMRKINWLITHLPFFDSIGWQLSIARLLLPKNNGATITRTISGFDVIVDPKNRPGFIDHDLYYLGTYEAGILKVISSLCNEDSIIIDVGANIGAITLFAATLARKGRVLAFEPIPGILDNLKDNVKLNKLSNVEIYPVALGPKAGTAKIRPDLTERGSSSLLKEQHSDHTFGKPITVQVQSLDKYTSGLPHVDLIKIDVEGYELGVLLGAAQTIQKYNPVIVLEYDPKSPLKTKLDNLLKTLNYDSFTLSMGKHYRSHLLPLDSPQQLPSSKLSTIVLLPRGA